jgi:hypothetical protein
MSRYDRKWDLPGFSVRFLEGIEECGAVVGENQAETKVFAMSRLFLGPHVGR